MTPLELYGNVTNERSYALSSELTGGESGQRLDAEYWLPAAAECYCLSKSLKDYIMVPVPTIISDIPNTNGVAFPRQELAKFNPMAGQLAGKTFKGKPTFLEHSNQDITKAKGVILDAFMTPLKGWGRGIIKVVELLAFDRSKDADLANAILAGDINSYSMGAYFEGYNCSLCGADRGGCRHTGPKDPLKQHHDGQLIYRNIYNIEGFETSAVANPAFISAISDRLMTFS